jgi:hypothetical protein
MDGLVFMDDEFDWRIEEQLDAAATRRPPPGRLPGQRFWLGVAIILLALGAAWWAVQRAVGQSRAESQASIQITLDAARDACRAGDGAAFFATQARDPAWRAALLHPDLIAAYCAGPAVSRVAAAGELTSANLVWTANGDTWQRLAFFTATPLGMVQVPPPAAYWGQPQRRAQPWGTLVTATADADLAPVVGQFVTELVAATCATNRCRPDSRPFTLELRGDYRQTAAPDQLALPSPRLLALDGSGAPPPAFWDALSAIVLAHITPGTIRFAVPPRLLQVINFEREAAEFMRRNPDIRVEIVTMEMRPEEPEAALAAYDGAAYTPSAAMIAAGLVRDLTEYAATDPAFDSGDFYEQAWQGAQWLGRMWLVPQAGQMRLLFLDCNACEGGTITPPSLRWTWRELDTTIAGLQASPPTETVGRPPAWTGEWALLDTTRDSLLSYAFGRQAACAGIVPARCGRPLGAAEVADALSWYRRLTVELGAMPDVAAVPAAERAHLMVNWQSGQRRAALWVDDAVNYEHQLQLGRVSVVPFPGSDRFDGNTPFWVHGSFISQSSQRPRDVWRWLVFLSRREVVGPLRYVPARPSVAEATGYWTVLPPPLRDALRTAFPFARPVGPADRLLFNRAQLDAVTGGALTPAEAARLPLPLRWFGAGE